VNKRHLSLPIGIGAVLSHGTAPFFDLTTKRKQSASVPLSLDLARRIVGKYIEQYNTVRLHSAIGYVTPSDKLNGRDQEIFKERNKKLGEAREQRKQKRQQAFPEIRHSGKADIPFHVKPLVHLTYKARLSLILSPQ
jgi:hypothetical protein